MAISCEFGSTSVFYTTYSYKSDYYANFGGNGVSAVEVLDNIYKTSGSKTDNFTVKCTDTTNFNKYTSEEWNSILNKKIAK